MTGNKRTNPKYTFDDYLYFTNTWNEILLDVQVIKYLSTLEIMHKLEYSIIDILKNIILYKY
jgi:hypothetical protein